MVPNQYNSHDTGDQLPNQYNSHETGNLLLHICCAPCAGAPSRILQEEGYALTGFWHGPNIHPREEWEHRRNSVEALATLRGMPMIWSDDFRQTEWQKLFSIYSADENSTAENMAGENSTAENMAGENRTDVNDTGENRSGDIAKSRCFHCHDIRMDAAARLAAERGIPLFTTSLTISPYQNHEAIREAGERAAAKYGVTFLYRDFRPYYREGIQLARGQGWYIQKYCGCLFSYAESDHPKKPVYDFGI